MTGTLVAVGEGKYGWAGAVWTNVLANEAFLWYVPGEVPSPSVLKEMRRVLHETGIRFWIAVDRREPRLARFARFFGFRFVGAYDQINDEYRIS